MQLYIVGTDVWHGNQNQQKIQIPAGVVAGDLILGFWFRSGGTTSAGQLDNGYSSLDNGGAATCGFRTYYKTAADSSEAGTLTDLAHFGSGSDNALTISCVLRGWTGTPVSGGYATATAAATQNPPNLTTGWGVTTYISLVFAFANAASATPASSGPSGYTQLNTDEGTGAGAMLYYKILTAASDDPGVVTWASGTPNGGAHTVGVRGGTPRGLVFHQNPGIF